MEQVRRRPTLNAFGQVGTLAQTSNFRFSDSRWPVVSFVGLQLNVPIFNAATAPKLQQARLAQQQAQEQLRYTRTAIANEVRSCLYALDEARDRIQAQAGVVRAAERSYSRAASRYRQGIIKLGDLTDAELALRQAQTNRLQAIYDYQVAQVDLERAKGDVE
ncbi:TolC family protein [Fibrella sp. USSR17]